MEKEIKYNVFCIGAGGTGSYFLKEFSRFIYKGSSRIKNMFIIDGDVVEQKNLARQAFSEEDLGENKAVALAEILNENFELNWRAVARYLSSVDELSKFSADAGTGTCFDHITIPVIIGCVDNHGARMICEEFFRNNDSCIYLDSANEFTTGEVVFSYKLNGVQLSGLRSERFPDMLKGDLRNVTDISCEELNQSAPQHIATNMLAGNILLSEMCSLLADKPHPGVVMFDSGRFEQSFIPAKPVEKDNE